MARKAYIVAITYMLPTEVEENTDRRLRDKTGIFHRHICRNDLTAADMAQEAAERLFDSGVQRKSIDFLLFCTQSPDYPLPTTACLLQEKLQIPQTAGALDFNLGCSGYIYGLGLAKGLIESGQAEHIILLTAETYSKYIRPEDHATRSVFGDAATATLIEAMDCEAEGMRAFIYGSDGSGAKQLIVPVGGMRNPFSETILEGMTDVQGTQRGNRNLFMDGAAIMEFALNVVPETVEKILAKASLKKNEVDYYVFHQANHFMLDYLRRKCSLMDCPYWDDVSEYGNTVSNSIPIALADLLRRENTGTRLKKVMLVGFGVGLSWGGCIADLSRMK